MFRCSIVAIALVLQTVAAIAETVTPPAAATPPAVVPAAKPDLTLAMFQKRREKAVMAADTDGDAKVSLSEWTTLLAKRGGKADPAKSFARIDSNHDNFIDHTEFDAFFAKRFARLDINADGVLAVDERAGHKNAAKPQQ